MNGLKELIRVWAPMVGLAFAGYYAYDYYVGFQQSDESPLKARVAELGSIELQNKTLEKKVRELEEFARQLESKKEQVRGIAQQLAESKEALSDDVQMPDFMKTLVSEAKRVGLTVLSITPSRKSQREYYYEYPVELRFRGIFAQTYSYINRLANMQRIVHVDRFQMKPVSSPSARYVELEGVLELKTFSYVGSKADQVGKESK